VEKESGQVKTEDEGRSLEEGKGNFTHSGFFNLRALRL